MATFLKRKRKPVAAEPTAPEPATQTNGHAPGKQRDPRPLTEIFAPLGRGFIWLIPILIVVLAVSKLTESSASSQVAGLKAQIAAVQRTSGSWPSSIAKAFAVQFSRTYLTWGSFTSTDQQTTAIAPYLTSALQSTDTTPETLPTTPGTSQTFLDGTIASGVAVDNDHALVTVLARVLRNVAGKSGAAATSQVATVYLAVPVGRDGNGNVAVYANPSVVAPLPVGAPNDEDVQSIEDPGSNAIGTLVDGFLGAYLGAQTSTQLSFFLTPGASVAPLNATYAVQGQPSLQQLGNGTGQTRTILAAVNAQDTATGAVYAWRYRLGVSESGGKWLITSIAGTPQ